VNFRAGSTDATAYFSDNLDDAVEYGRVMAASALAGFIARGRRAQEAADRAITETAGKAPRRRQRRPLKMTPKAIRRRMIRLHNRRLRARAIKRQDDL
jgi:hypothetical protein